MNNKTVVTSLMKNNIIEKSLSKIPNEENNNDNVKNILRKLPDLDKLFDIKDKIGEGTFSSVFLATLKSTTNSPSSSSYYNRKRFAIKYLVPTCHPGRIERELKCLQDIGGVDNVIGLDICLRNAECVAFVMPYMKHDRFSEYVNDMSVDETINYMKALLVALKRVHSFNIIHRDIKPSNFLYDRFNKRYRLVDFGLAQEYLPQLMKEEEEDKEEEEEVEEEGGGIGNYGDNNLHNKKNDNIYNKNYQQTCSGGKRKRGESIGKHTYCSCFGKAQVCSICQSKSTQTAPRAGTPGFRAPEVLLKYPAQTTAIDIWASGVIMLCILSGTHPFFRSPDDCTALAEITSVFGSNKMQHCAKKLGKKLTFSENIDGIDIKLICKMLKKRNNDKTIKRRLYNDNDDDDNNDDDKSNAIIINNSNSNSSIKNNNNKNNHEKGIPNNTQEYPNSAYDLLIKLLDPDHLTRITAEEALNHPFFQNS